MDLMNCREEAPEYYYIFMNRNHDSIFNQACYNNYLLTKRVITNGIETIFFDKAKFEDFANGNIICLPFIRNDISIQSTSPFMFRVINRYNIEHNLEYFRQTNYKSFPSRFSGIYAFGDIKSCKEISDGRKWKGEDVRKFKLADEVVNKYAKIVKRNFKMISLLEHIDLPIFPIEEQEKIYSHYWNGKGNLEVIVPNVNDRNGEN